MHITVNGNMHDVTSAALDPIFYVHHSEVDRQWNQWLAQGGGRSSPVGNATWRNTTYTFFDECCTPVRMRGCDVIRAARQLSYSYEGEPPQVEQYCPRIPLSVREIVPIIQWRRPLILRERPVRFPLVPPEQRNMLPRLAQAARGRGNLALRVGSIEADAQPGVSWEVHVGPPGFTPGPATFVGIFALFGAGLKTRRNHYHPAEFVFPLRKALATVDPAGMEVQFVPVSGLAGPAARERIAPRSAVSVGDVSVVVDTPPPPLPREEQERLRRLERLQ